MKACTDSPDGQMLLAIRQFNGGEWFECHETLEEMWVGSEGELRNFYQGMLQVAIALLHWRNGNFGGALSLLRGGAGYLRRTADVCHWVDVVALVREADAMHAALAELGEPRMAELDRALLPRVRTVS